MKPPRFVRSFNGALISIDQVVRFEAARTKGGRDVFIAVLRDGARLRLDPFYDEPGRLELAIGMTQPAETRERRRMQAWRAEDAAPQR